MTIISDSSPAYVSASTAASTSASASTIAAHADPSPTTLVDTDNPEVDAETGEGEQKKIKKLKSDVWTGYDAIHQGKYIIATCIYCKKVINHESRLGTTRLRNHTERCPKNPHKPILQGQTLLGKLSSTSDSSLKLAPHKFEESIERMLFAKMIAKHDYPFLMAEHPYFRDWVSYLMPSYGFRSRTTIRKDLDTVYEQEKSRIYVELENVTSRVSLTTDDWKPLHQNRSYFCLTCHYVDSEWKLHKHVLAFHVVPFPHQGVDKGKWLKDRILEWNLDIKLFSVVVDNASNNTGMLNGVRVWLRSKSALLSDGEMFHMRCAPHILNLIVKSGLERLGGLIDSIVKTQRHISHSPGREEKFYLALKQYKFNPNRRIPSDVDTRWNSTYTMLVVSIELKDVIKCYVEFDCSYTYLPSEEEWEIGEKICNCLKVFDEVTKTLSGSLYLTANYYFLEIQKIRQCIKEWRDIDDVNICLMASSMHSKFEKYWAECNKVLTVGGVLDPRFKMHIVKFFFESIYGKDSNEESDFRKYLFSLYDEYKVLYSEGAIEDSGYCSSSNIFGTSGSTSSCTSKLMKSLSNFLVESNVVTSYGRKNELEEYLEEALQPMMNERFDILGWWKKNGAKYPLVARMARDILAIPTSSIASESSFSHARRIITDSRASLLSESVERLMCVKD